MKDGPKVGRKPTNQHGINNEVHGKIKSRRHNMVHPRTGINYEFMVT
jgi:hypothetical protein